MKTQKIILKIFYEVYKPKTEQNYSLSKKVRSQKVKFYYIYKSNSFWTNNVLV